MVKFLLFFCCGVFIDVMVSLFGDFISLWGGIFLVMFLVGVDGEVYVVV